MEYPDAVAEITRLGDDFVFGPSPTRISNLITKIDQVSKSPEFIAMAPSLTKDMIYQWILKEQPASQYPGSIGRVLSALQIAFASNPMRIAIINKAFVMLTDLAATDPMLIGWLTYALNKPPKLKRAGDESSYMDAVIPDFDVVCQRIDSLDKSDAEADASVMLVLAKWIHDHAEEDIDKVRTLFNALAERYIDNDGMLLLLNKALTSLYELGAMTDEPTIQIMLKLVPRLTIGPASTECQTLAEQLEYWMAEGNLHAASQLIDAWKTTRAEVLKYYPDILENMLHLLIKEFSSTPELKSQINEILLMQGKHSF